MHASDSNLLFLSVPLCLVVGVAFAVLSDVPSAPLFLPLFTLNLKSAFSRGFSFRKLQIFISQTTDFHFANYKFSFRKLQIFISQTTDFHFANYRFSFRFVPFRFVSFRFAPFRFANYSKPSGRARNTANKHPLLRFHVRNRPCTCRQQ